MLAAMLLLAGAAKIDVSPPGFPVIVNCGFLEKKADKLQSPLFSKAIVLSDGTTRIAIVVVDSCMMPRELIDEAKRIAAANTEIPENRILISATHTHSAPAAMACLGSSAEKEYAAWLPGRIAESIAQAAARVRPARIGWAVAQAPNHTHTRRWIYYADRMLTDPFGNQSVRANMHPGHQNPNAISPSGPSDPGLTVVSIQSRIGEPIAVLANYSQHYFGAQPVSADYYGLFSTYIAEKISAKSDFVAIMSQGTSGDQQWMDYSQPKPTTTIETYARELADIAHGAFKSIRYQPAVPIAMAESKLRLRRRTPDAPRLAWAQAILDKMGTRLPANQPEVYAREAMYLHQEPERELKLQAIRIGELGIAAIPDEVYAITGLKIKAQSPLPTTFNIELANGAEGYIPPPEQHLLGGYTTWPARTAGLEVQAEPRIVESILGLLEKAAVRPRMKIVKRTQQKWNGRRPAHYWPLDEMQGSAAIDHVGKANAVYEGGVAFYLPGPTPETRAAHFAGGHLVLKPPVKRDYTIRLQYWAAADGPILRGVSVDGPLRQWRTLTAHLDREEDIVVGESFQGKIAAIELFPGRLTRP